MQVSKTHKSLCIKYDVLGFTKLIMWSVISGSAANPGPSSPCFPPQKGPFVIRKLRISLVLENLVLNHFKVIINVLYYALEISPKMLWDWTPHLRIQGMIYLLSYYYFMHCKGIANEVTIRVIFVFFFFFLHEHTHNV